jgi:hypothetical protein
MESPMVSRYFVLLMPKYRPQRLFLENLQAIFFSQYKRPSFTPPPIIDKVTVLRILIFMFSDSKQENKIFCTEWQQAFAEFNMLLIS